MTRKSPCPQGLAARLGQDRNQSSFLAQNPAWGTRSGAAASREVTRGFRLLPSPPPIPVPLTPATRVEESEPRKTDGRRAPRDFGEEAEAGTRRVGCS